MGIYWVLFGGSVNLSIHLKYNLLCYEAESLQFLEPLGCEGISFSSSNPWNLLGLPLPKSFLSHQLVQFSSDTQSCPTLCNPMELQHSRLPCPSPTQGAYMSIMSIELVMPSNHLILCHPLLLPPSIFPSIRLFSNESVLHIKWPK